MRQPATTRCPGSRGTPEYDRMLRVPYCPVCEKRFGRTGCRTGWQARDAAIVRVPDHRVPARPA